MTFQFVPSIIFKDAGGYNLKDLGKIAAELPHGSKMYNLIRTSEMETSARPKLKWPKRS